MRTMKLVRFFQRYGPIDIVYSRGTPGEERERGTFSNTYHLPVEEYPKRFSKRLLMFGKGVPYPVLKYDRISSRRLLEIVKRNDYDYIVARYVRSTHGLFQLPPKYRMRTIMDFDDILSGSLYELYFSRAAGVYRKFIRYLNKKLLIRYEKRCLNFGAVLFCSEIDKRKKEPTGKNKNVFVVPNVYENESFGEFDFGAGYQNRNTLLFVGSLAYSANVDGLRWFIKVIYERFRRDFRGGELFVVGHSPAGEIKALCAKGNGIELHADVPDVREYYKRSRAVIVPLLAGGGTRIKILEAALAGRPVLSTALGAEGLDLRDGREVLLFEDAEEFCSKYRELLTKDRYESITNNARQTVLKKYSKDTFEEAMRRVVEYLDRSKDRESIHPI